MRLLTVLSVVQIAGLLALGFLVLEYGRSDSASAPRSATGAHATTATAEPAGSDLRVADEAYLRRIIREELAAHANASAAGSTPAAVRDPAKDLLQRDRVARQIGEYRRLGTISPAQMEQLQQQIAQLDPATRKQMLSALTRAMNLRQIDSRF